MSFCYFNNGESMTSVTPDYPPQAGEVLFEHYASDAELDAAFPGRAAARLAERHRGALTRLNAACETALAALKADCPESEVSSWAKQEAEARALQADPATAAPLLSAIAAARGLTVDELAARVLAKSDAYAVAAGALIGRRQALEDALTAIDLAAPDAEARIDAIRWEPAP